MTFFKLDTHLLEVFFQRPHEVFEPHAIARYVNGLLYRLHFLAQGAKLFGRQYSDCAHGHSS